MKESKHKKYSTKEIKSNLKIQFEMKTVKTIMGVLVLSLILTTVSAKEEQRQSQVPNRTARDG